MFQDFAAPSLQNDAFDLQAGRSGWPVVANGKQSKIQTKNVENHSKPQSWSC